MSTAGAKIEPALKVEEEQADVRQGSSQEQYPGSEEHDQHPTSAQPISTSTINGALSAIAPIEDKLKASTNALAKAAGEKTMIKSSVKVWFVLCHTVNLR
jgi:hypothetical protein